MQRLDDVLAEQQRRLRLRAYAQAERKRREGRAALITCSVVVALSVAWGIFLELLTAWGIRQIWHVGLWPSLGFALLFWVVFGGVTKAVRGGKS